MTSPRVSSHTPARAVTVDTALGPLLLVATDSGLARVAFGAQGIDDELARLAEIFALHGVDDPSVDPVLDRTRTQLGEYLSGVRTRFDIAIDWVLATGFRRRVQQQLPAIPYGQTRSYRDLAVAVGAPDAGRAVGSACAMNPLPVVVPCHRVIRSDGSLGGYAGGLQLKQQLLELEQG